MLPSIPLARLMTEALHRRLDLGVGAPEPSGPLDHPDLRRMTPLELADLPLPRPKTEPVPSAADALGKGHDLAA